MPAGGPPPCPGNWEYKDFAGADAQLRRLTVASLRYLRLANPVQKLAQSQDTRPVHAIVFKGLTPDGFPYYAGNYRGTPLLRCLDIYEVGIQGSPEVGHTAATVSMEMEKLSKDVGVASQELDFVWATNEKVFSREAKLFRLVEVAAAVFVYFLEIHPYANGNGHMARFVVMALMGRHGVYFNAGFDLHPRPSEPAYSEAIKAYRAGNPSDLHILLINCL